MPLTHWLQTYKLKKVTSDHRQYSPKHLSQWTQNIKFLIVYLCQCLHSNHEPTPTIWRCQFLRKESRWYIKSFQQNGSRNIFTTSALVLPPIFSELLWGRGTGSQSRKDTKKNKTEKKTRTARLWSKVKRETKDSLFQSKGLMQGGKGTRKPDHFDSKTLQNEKKIFASNKSFLPRINSSD